jgi:hypothetical protein
LLPGPDGLKFFSAVILASVETVLGILVVLQLIGLTIAAFVIMSRK